MESKFNLVLIAAALFVLIGEGAQVTLANSWVAQTQQGKTASSGTDNNKATAGDCAPLTPAMLEKALGDSFKGNAPEKALPMYGGASGSSCTYRSQAGVRIDFSIYAEASPAKARQDFDTYGVAADDSKGKPAIGDGAYWVQPTKTTLAIFVLKGKVHFSITMHPGNQNQLKDLAAAVAAGI